jgi:hypothetical protein
VKKHFLFLTMAISFVGIIASCYTLDTMSDISISLQQPETVTIHNDSYVSTLNSIKFEIKRDGITVYTYDDECLVTAGETLSIVLHDCVIQNGDVGVIISGNLSWSM